MNQRIEKLAEQATEEMDPEAFSEDMNIPAEWYQKFAELIVRECANIVNSLEQYEGQGDCSTAEYIKERFGVEE